MPSRLGYAPGFGAQRHMCCVGSQHARMVSSSAQSTCESSSSLCTEAVAVARAPSSTRSTAAVGCQVEEQRRVMVEQRRLAWPLTRRGALRGNAARAELGLVPSDAHGV
eukprot:scaffold13096_cov57-Phaeocystis_antarctica.AAC.1